jgi:hypothetical protein
LKSTRPVSFAFTYACAAARCHAVNRGEARRRCAALVSQMTELVLKNIGKHIGAAPWVESEKDYIVLNDAGRIIGRIVMRARSPKGRPWVWTITARVQPPSFYNHGDSETRASNERFQGSISCVGVSSPRNATGSSGDRGTGSQRHHEN